MSEGWRGGGALIFAIAKMRCCSDRTPRPRNYIRSKSFNFYPPNPNQGRNTMEVITNTTASKTRDSASWTVIVAVLALLIALAAAIELVVYYRDTHRVFGKVEQNFGLLIEQNKQLQVATSSLQDQVAKQQDQLTKLQELSSGKQRPWVLAEINYLIHLASYNLNYTRDIPAGIALLQAADQRAASLNDPSLNQLRQRLADAIAKLQAQPKLDLAGLLAKINALQGQIKQLPLVAPPVFTATKAATSEPAPTEHKPMWRKALKQSFETLKSLIIIRHHSQPIEPLLNSEQQVYMQQNLQLLLQRASWAALQGQRQLYRDSLQQAANWVGQYFAADAAFTRSFLQTLKDLQKMDVQPVMPDMRELQDTLQQLEHSVQTKEG